MTTEIIYNKIPINMSYLKKHPHGVQDMCWYAHSASVPSNLTESQSPELQKARGNIHKARSHPSVIWRNDAMHRRHTATNTISKEIRENYTFTCFFNVLLILI